MAIQAVLRTMRRTVPRWGGGLLAAAGALALGATLLGYGRQQSSSALGLWALRLETVAAEGAAGAGRVLDQWEADAVQLAGMHPFAQFLSDTAKAAARQVETAGTLLDMPRRGYGYEGALLLDEQGSLVLARPAELATEDLLSPVRESLEAGRPRAFCRGPSGKPLVACPAPVRRRSGPDSPTFRLGTVVLVADPGRAFFPALWRTAAIVPPAHVALVEVTPRAVNVLGRKGPGESWETDAGPMEDGALRLFPPSGPDMRSWGEDVYAVGRPVAGTPWSCVAFVGRSEILREARLKWAAVAAAASALYVSLLFLLYLLSHRREMIHLRRLGETERRHATLLSNLPGIAYRCANDPRWTMEFVSEGCLELTGYSARQLEGNADVAFGDLIHPEDRKPVWDGIQEALESNARYTLAYRIRTREGRTKYVWEQGSGLRGPDGQVEALEGFITDVSPRVEAEERLRAAQEELGRARALEAVGLVAGGVAHEVRNPLQAIEALVGGLERKTRGLADLSEFHQHLGDQVRRLKDLMNDLLLLGKPLHPSEFQSVSLSEVLRPAVEQAILGRGCGEDAVETRQAPGDLRVHGVPLRLQQVFVNLIQNALHFSAEGATVRVTTSSEGGQAVVSVEDSGPGIASEILPRLFEPFSSGRKGGTGLGLAIAKRTVEAHGGVLSARNNHAGPGATFTVRLPLERESAQAPPLPGPSKHRLEPPP
ncbi:MAG: PAS domain-containing sensor histidine kinase [Acidobacteriota bacterium]